MLKLPAAAERSVTVWPAILRRAEANPANQSSRRRPACYAVSASDRFSTRYRTLAQIAKAEEVRVPQVVT